MSILNELRNSAFWLLDKVKGGRTKKHFNDIQSKMSNLGSKETEAKIKNSLKDLLSHAIDTVPYYKGFDLTKGLASFPVLDKLTIKENFEKFNSNAFSKEELATLTTSGSTGTPFSVYQNQDKRARNTADTVYFAQKTGYKLGQKLYYLKIWSEANKKSPLKAWMQNVVQIDVIELSDEKLHQLVDTLEKESSPFGILGYSSALEQLCQYLERKNSKKVNTKVRSIISMSESLSQETKEDLHKYFGQPAYSRYSNTENGILAQQYDADDSSFLVNVASFHLEIFDINEDRPIKDGQLGRIIITDLHNFALPMIRYDSGDLGVLETRTVDGIPKRILSTVEGRKLDQLYNTKGQIVSSLLMYKNMWKYKEITQYQIVQKGVKDYTLKINIEGSFNREEEIVDEYKSYFGSDAMISIDYVDEIPLLNSGKRKKVVNEYYK